MLSNSILAARAPEMSGSVPDQRGTHNGQAEPCVTDTPSEADEEGSGLPKACPDGALDYLWVPMAKVKRKMTIRTVRSQSPQGTHT